MRSAPGGKSRAARNGKAVDAELAPRRLGRLPCRQYNLECVESRRTRRCWPARGSRRGPDSRASRWPAATHAEGVDIDYRSGFSRPLLLCGAAVGLSCAGVLRAKAGGYALIGAHREELVRRSGDGEPPPCVSMGYATAPLEPRWEHSDITQRSYRRPHRATSTSRTKSQAGCAARRSGSAAAQQRRSRRTTSPSRGRSQR
jgi:hypothetical protein